MNDPRQRIAKPPNLYLTRKSSIEAVRRHPYHYVRCPTPNCPNWKTKYAKLCRPCQTLSLKPPIREDTVVVEGKPCRFIPLTRGRYETVDADKYDLLMQYTWYKTKQGYAATNEATVQGVPRQTIFMHNLILDLPPHVKVDHKNRDKSDNRVDNLRPATHRQNSHNRGPQKNNTTGYVGVSLAYKSKYRATIYIDKKQYYLGCFDTPEEAAYARDAKVQEIRGEYAFINLPHDSSLSPAPTRRTKRSKTI
jgi:hypothetical protein